MEAVRAAQGKRVERMNKDKPPGGEAAAPLPEDRPPPREAMVASMVELGYTRAAAEASYDRQVAAWEANRDPH